jgi:Cys-rich repeat protein
MISNRTSRVLGGACAVVGLGAFVACGGSASPADMGSKYVKTVSVGPEGATIRVTDSDSSAIAGTSITIPAHALATTTTISIGISTVSVVSKAPAHSVAIGPVVDFEPSGTQFAVPATMTLPVTLPSGADASQVYVEAVEADGSARAIAATYEAGIATIQVSGFTSFGGLEITSPTSSACTTDADCSSGESCVSGVCVVIDGGAPDSSPDVIAEPDAPGNCTTDSECPTGEVCLEGRCGVLSDASTDAGGDVTDTGSDVIDGAADASDDVVCTSPDTDCSGTCVDTDTDPTNCGKCGTRCPSGICSSGVCS